MEKLKLAFAVSLYFEYGGMQRTLLRIAEECVRRGHAVDVYTGGWIGERPPALGVHVLDTRALSNVRSNDLLAQKLERVFAGGGYDCVVGFTKIPGLDVYYAGDPCYAARVEEAKGRLYRLNPRYRGLRRQEAAVFAPGAGVEILLIAHRERDKFMRCYGTEPERFHLLPPGINQDRLKAHCPDAVESRRLRRELGVGAGELMVLTVGSRFKTKGVDRSLRAVSALPAPLRQRTQLVVVGDDRQRPFRQLARSLGVADQVTFAGARQDIARFYYAADLLIHPPYSENTGTVLIEAMICGLPVLTTANCGFAFHVEQAQAGLVCPTPFAQARLGALLHEMLISGRHDAWRQNGPRYCARTDLYSLIERAADVIIARAKHNRDSR